MAVTEMLRMYARDGIGDELREAAAGGLHLFVDDPGCRKVRLFRQEQDPTCFILAAEWDSAEAHKAWAGSEALPKWRALLADLRDERTEPLGHFETVIERSG
jgi:quinol monooxygenase YgiN